MKSNERKREILAAALEMAVYHGYNRITREQIAAEARCSPALVSHVLGTMAALRRAVMGEAIRTRCLPVIAQGLVAGDSRAQRAPDELRHEAVSSLL